jgi:hypothetical protein
MRKLVAALLGLALCLGYLATPFLSALQIRQAIKAGDTQLLEALVDFPQVRQSLKASLGEIERQKAAASQTGPIARPPSLWERIKAAATPANIHETLIDRYVTPDGIVRMAAARRAYKAVQGQMQPADAQAGLADSFDAADFEQRPLVERMMSFFNRLKRAEFHSLGRIELEVADRKVAERRYVGMLEFKGLGWKLTSLEVRGVGF